MKFKQFSEEVEDRLLKEVLGDLELVVGICTRGSPEIKEHEFSILNLYKEKYENDVIPKSGFYGSSSDLFKKVYQGIKGIILTNIGCQL
ncbi:MAG: hypothetical protein KJ623_03865 [Nanoarchaeota archaeon]|nr:hypothetical protein [Nanoarchaeota archaeon]